MIRAFSKKVKHRVYQVGDLVVKRITLPQGDPRGKWTPTCEGPFVVKIVFFGGAMILSTMDGEEFPHPVNANIVKKYYAETRPARLTGLCKNKGILANQKG